MLRLRTREGARSSGFSPWVWWIIPLAVTAPLTIYWWNLIVAGSVAFDWRIFVEAGHRIWAGSPDLYEVGELYSFRHSPIMALLMPGIAWIGTIGVRLVTVAAVLAMPTWPMRILAIVSWPFAMDLQHGALITVIVVVAAHGIRGSRVASVAFIVLTLLSPRPLMIPVAVFLLWQQRWLRKPALVLFVVHALAVAATGYGDEWVAILTSVAMDMVVGPYNLSPSRFLGSAWVPLGVALAAVLTWRRHPGWAALAINPYVLPHYLLLLLLELVPGRRPEPSTTAVPVVVTSPP